MIILYVFGSDHYDAVQFITGKAQNRVFSKRRIENTGRANSKAGNSHHHQPMLGCFPQFLVRLQFAYKSLAEKRGHKIGAPNA